MEYQFTSRGSPLSRREIRWTLDGYSLVSDRNQRVDLATLTSGRFQRHLDQGSTKFVLTLTDSAGSVDVSCTTRNKASEDWRTFISLLIDICERLTTLDHPPGIETGPTSTRKMILFCVSLLPIVLGVIGLLTGSRVRSVLLLIPIGLGLMVFFWPFRPNPHETPKELIARLQRDG